MRIEESNGAGVSGYRAVEATRLGDREVRIRMVWDQDGSAVTVVYRREMDTHFTVSSVNDRGETLIRDGRLVANGAKVTRFRRCDASPA